MPSSHSSSSHSSSSHSSFGGGGGGFHHSFSSHSSSSHSSSGQESSNYRPTRKVTSYVLPAERPRTNQPTRSGRALTSYSLFRSVSHDYFYYPEDWTDETTGRKYKSGYYDEKGNYSKQVILRKNSQYETRAICNYCGTQIKLKWTKGALPSCPNCGASLSEIMDGAVIEEQIKPVAHTSVVADTRSPDDTYFRNGQHIGALDKIDTSKLSSVEKEESINSGRIAGGFIVVVTAIVLAVIVGDAVNTKNSTKGHVYTYSSEEWESIEQSRELDRQTATPEPTPAPEYYFKFVAEEDFYSTIYVDAIGRECSWHSSGNYYDKTTDCYFWLNTDVEPPIWQYWYEGISSAYGDYGWMEYDFAEDKWYIEASAGNWIVLPEGKYDKDRLWHMSSPDDGRYMGHNLIYVNEIGRTCEYIEEERNYYDPATKCHFYYDTYTGKGFWCYWFEDFREEHGIGWMRYDPEQNCWCVENQTRWYPLGRNVYDFSKCWHIGTEPLPMDESGSDQALSEETSAETSAATT